MDLKEIKEEFAIWYNENELILNSEMLDRDEKFKRIDKFRKPLRLIEENGYFIKNITWYNIKDSIDKNKINNKKDKSFYFNEIDISKDFDISSQNKVYNHLYYSNENGLYDFYPCLTIEKAELNFVPSNYKKDEKVVVDFLKRKTNKNFLSLLPQTQFYYLNNERMTFPSRNYCEEITKEEYEQFTDIQKCILDCIMTLNHNGYVREKHLKNILNTNYGFEPFFIFNLAQSYVVEILEVIYENESKKANKYLSFVNENRVLVEKGYQRMISYWNEYYRTDNWKFKSYVGTKLFK